MSFPTPGQDPEGQKAVFLTAAIAAVLREELQDCATVEADQHGGSPSAGKRLAVYITPARAGACPVLWIDFGSGIVLEVGASFGGRWELETTQNDISFLGDVVRSVVAGRVREVLALGRSAITVTLGDGTPAREVGYETPHGCLPLPYWRRWSRGVQYLPYRTEQL
ncbi:hypothetical protein [Catellatospora citrea]|uniref:Uncharacterized protein n=1 Tax=Catellatospora citrea TaxID=53366 RepID=A0A8J3KH05_9ACTN|nr:hypothetical protein [Catellatospora citrea]GIF95719.1 hypothetical protein Cci01nite_08130 [Catellatospora citrea]